MKPIRRHASVLAVAVVACGLVAPASATARIPEPASWQPLPLQLRLLQAGVVAGLAPVGAPRLVRPHSSGAPDAIVASHAGFLMAAVERLASHGSDLHAVDVVAAFESVRGARDQVESWAVWGGMSRSIAAIPGAVCAFDRGSIGIAFADGRFAYLLEAEWPGRGTGSATWAQFAAGATELYGRVRGHPLG